MKEACNKIRDLYWLVKDYTANDEDLKTYREHLNSCRDCLRFVNDTDEILDDYSSQQLYDLDESTYTKMLSKSTGWISLLKRKFFIRKQINYGAKYTKYAFIGLVLIISVLTIVFFNTEKRNNHLRKPVLSFDWKAEKIENNIQKIDSSLVYIQTKKFSGNLQKDPWKSSAYLLARDIEKMKMELKNSTL